MNILSIDQCREISAGSDQDFDYVVPSMLNIAGISVGGAIGASTGTLPVAIPVTLITLNLALFFLGAASEIIEINKASNQ